MVSSYQRAGGRARRASHKSTSPTTTSSATSSSGSPQSGGSGQQATAGASGRSGTQLTAQASNRLCAHCRNHGERVPVRGHKRYCPFKGCPCSECRLVRERQIVVARHLYMRRAQDQDEEAAARAGVQNSPSSPTPAAPEELVVPRRRNTLQPAIPYVAAAAADTMSADVHDRILFESLLELHRSFPVSNAGLPLLLCILKIYRSVPEASRKIVQGTQELAAMGMLGMEAPAFFPRPL